MMKRPTMLFALLFGAVTIALLVVWICLTPSNGTIEFVYENHISSSNVTTVTVLISNDSADSFYYLALAPQVKTNGGWAPAVFPVGHSMSTLTNGQSTMVQVTITNAVGEMRVPVLWGLTYDIPANRTGEMLADLGEWWRARRHGVRGKGIGTLYTNHVVVPTR